MSLSNVLPLENVFTDGNPEPVRMCRICLISDSKVKMFHMNNYKNLRNYYYHLINFMVINNDFKTPQYLCWECTRHLMKSNQLRIKALKSISLLSALVGDNQPVSSQTLDKLKREGNNLSSNLKSVIMSEENLCVKPFVDEMVIETLKQEKPDEILESIDSVLEVVKEDKDLNERVLQNLFDQNRNKNLVQNNSNSNVIDKDYINKWEYEVNIKDETTEEPELLHDNYNTTKNEYETIESNFKELKCDSVETSTSNNEVESRKYISCKINKEIEISYEAQREVLSNKDANNLFKRTKLNTTNNRIEVVQKNKDEHNIVSCSSEATENINGKTPNLVIRFVQNTSKQSIKIRSRQNTNAASTPSSQHKVVHDESLLQKVDDTHQVPLKLGNNVEQASKEDKLSCNECGKSFKDCHRLKRHKKIHTGEKPYSCIVCGKAFNNSSHLKTHNRVHTGEKPYSCNICGKAYRYSFYLKTHNKIHTGEKPYSCDVCGKAFRNHSNLKAHNKIHTGEKSHSCNVCGKAFSQFGGLKTHKRTHTGEKLYSCDMCPQKFKHKISLVGHLQKHTQFKV